MSRRHGRLPDDGYPGTPGANDNASGIAATLALARVFARRECARTIRFVAFVNEEPPFFKTPEMGSLVHALGCRARGERIVAMFTPETLGYYTDEPGTQRLAPVFGRDFAAPGDFVALLGSWRSRRLIESMLAGFRAATDFPIVGIPVPRLVGRVAWSDDWSFWQAGYPGVTVTDTAYLRYRHYHTPEDTPEKLVYPRMARVVAALAAMLEGLAAGESAAE
jgi:Zn-dependent M28 family amino/carboxypeptidase